MMDNITEIKKFRQNNDNERLVNEYLQNGWVLLNIVEEIFYDEDTKNAISSIMYVIGKPRE